MLLLLPFILFQLAITVYTVCLVFVYTDCIRSITELLGNEDEMRDLHVRILIVVD